MEKIKKKPSPKLSTRAIGAKGERAARRYLKRIGCRIIAKNYRAAHGEIDIVAWDKRDKRTVFIEVKSRKDDPESIQKYGRAAAAVNSQKRTRFLTAVQAYQREHKDAVRCRIDIVEVYFPQKPRLFSKPRIVHLRSAFGMESFKPRTLHNR